jgi:phosphoribosylformimino-5-aminoimidazole carboxamide ribotide isomerase
MLVIPAIDLRNGRCVRLVQGDPGRETVYSDDPLSVARLFESLGARLIHVVDLDGAFAGAPVNADLVLTMAGALSIPIEVGGGIRSAESIERYLRGGVRRIIIGSAALGPGFTGLVERYGNVIVAGVDARDSMVAVEGWKRTTGLRAVDFIKDLKKSGIGEIIYTDIATDGMLTGPNFDAFASILAGVPGISLIASGGVSSLQDIRRLGEMEAAGLKGCIVGKAIYDGRIDAREALSLYPR